MPCLLYQYNCYYCVKLCCVLVELIIPYQIPIIRDSTAQRTEA